MQRTSTKIFVTVLTCLVVLLVALPPATAGNSEFPPRQTGPYATANSSTNVRSGPGTGFSPIGALSPGEIVPILAVNPDSSWWVVNTRFGEGWVSNTAVTTYNTADVPVRDPGPIGMVIVNVVNVRSGPGPEAPATGQLTRGQQVFLIGANADGTWMQVQWAAGSGWVASQYLTTTGVPGVIEAEVPNTAPAPFAVINAAYLNVRSGPGQNYSSLGRVAGGDILPILGQTADGGWFQVDTDYGVGWISSKYVITRNEYGNTPTTETTEDATVVGPIGIINTGALHVRSGPGPQYTSLGTLAGGEQGRIIGRSTDWSWWLMETSVGNGWVNALYVITRGDISGVPYAAPGAVVPAGEGQGGGEAPEAELSGPVAIVKTGALHVRSGPNSAFPSLGQVTSQTRLPIIGQSPDHGWWLVESPYGQGWVTKAYTYTEGDTSNIPVSQ